VVLLILSIEMIFGVEIFKDDTTNMEDSSTIFPVVFPLIAGPGSFTTPALNAGGVPHREYHHCRAGKHWHRLPRASVFGSREKTARESGSYILRKFFGVILMADLGQATYLQYERVDCLGERGVTFHSQTA